MSLVKTIDEYYMKEALIEARKAFEACEVPVGAVLVYQNKIIARAYNQVESLKDATAHAEFLCMQQGARFLDNWRLLDCTLYCTLEPCCMCAGAMILSRVNTLVWGAPDLRHGADGSVFELFEGRHPIHNFNIRRSVLAEESSRLLKDFFKARRKQSFL